MDRDKDRFRSSPPINEGEEYEVKIESMGREGDGIARVKNFVIIVPGVQKGDMAKIKINKVARRVAFADVVEMLEESGEEEEVGEETLTEEDEEEE